MQSVIKIYTHWDFRTALPDWNGPGSVLDPQSTLCLCIIWVIINRLILTSPLPVFVLWFTTLILIYLPKTYIFFFKLSTLLKACQDQRLDFWDMIRRNILILSFSLIYTFPILLVWCNPIKQSPSQSFALKNFNFCSLVRLWWVTVIKTPCWQMKLWCKFVPEILKHFISLK